MRRQLDYTVKCCAYCSNCFANNNGYCTILTSVDKGKLKCNFYKTEEQYKSDAINKDD